VVSLQNATVEGLATTTQECVLRIGVRVSAHLFEHVSVRNWLTRTLWLWAEVGRLRASRDHLADVQGRLALPLAKRVVVQLD